MCDNSNNNCQPLWTENGWLIPNSEGYWLLSGKAEAADPKTGQCIATGLQRQFAGGIVAAGSSTEKVGGHWNFNVQLQFSSQLTADRFQYLYAASATSGMPPPARFGSGSGPALHLEHLGDRLYDSSSGVFSFNATAHIIFTIRTIASAAFLGTSRSTSCGVTLFRRLVEI